MPGFPGAQLMAGFAEAQLAAVRFDADRRRRKTLSRAGPQRRLDRIEGGSNNVSGLRTTYKHSRMHYEQTPQDCQIYVKHSKTSV